MSNKFSIELHGDLDFEGMVIEVSFAGQTIARMNYEKGVDNIEVEMLLHEESVRKLVFPLKDFLMVLEKAKQLVVRCAEEDQHREND